MQVSISFFPRRAISALAPFLFVLSAYAQTGFAPAKAPADRSAGVVSIDLVAHDKKGAVVRDLKAADFEIASGSQALHVDDLHMVTAGQGPGHSHLVTLVFAHDNPGYARVGRDIAAELLKAAPTSGILFAVVRIDGRLRLIQEFTTDRAALSKAIDAATVSFNRDNDAAEKQLAADVKAGADKPDEALPLRKVLLAMLLDSQTLVRDPHTPPAIAGLTAASRQLGALPGRKTLVYFSSGLDWDISAPEMPSKVAAAAVRARVSIYSIDAEILDPHSTNGALAGMNAAFALASGGISTGGVTDTAGLATAVGEQVGRMEAGDSNSNESRLSAICHATGGEHAPDSGNIGKTVQRIVDDTLQSYSAYFVPPDQGGKQRPLRIKVLRPGISVDARGGYYRVHGVPSLAVAPAGEKLVAALAAPQLPSELQFSSSILRFEHTPKGSVNSMAVEVPLGQAAANVSVLAQVRDHTGAIIERFTEDTASQPLPGANPGTASFRHHFIAAPGAYVLETAVMDASSGKVGAQRTKFEILPPASGPTLGDIVLVRQIEPDGAAADSSEPLHCSEGKVVPNLSAHLAKDTNPSILLFVAVQPDGGSSEKPTLKLEVSRDGNLLGTVPLNLKPDSTPGTIRELAKVGTKSLRPGTYDMTVVLSQGERAVERTLSVTLE
jgi:VWFA-related protein